MLANNRHGYARILSEFGDTINEPTNVRLKKHHEDNESFR